MKLLSELVVGELTLPNRIVMAPLTRCRAGGGKRVPNPLMAEYYAQRASAGLIISEATSVDPMGVGYPDTPGIWSDEQVNGWKQVTAAVHDRGGRIFLQLWHVGRISHSIYLDGKQPVSASAIAAEGHVSLVRPITPFPEPRALSLDEIPAVIESYRLGAINAQKAGFDGVEIHGANGYLLDQFLQDSSNHRTDEYGGSVENRGRLMMEVTDAVVSVWGAGRVGMHLAPRGDAHSMGDSDRTGTFSYAVQELGKRKIAFICAREYVAENSLSPMMKEKFGGVYIANEGMTPDLGETLLLDGKADAIAFGKSYIANPDLVDRIKGGAILNEPNPKTFYGAGAEGYTDYPFLENI